MSVGRWMTRDVITIRKGDPASLAFELLLTNDIRHLPVLSRGKLVGIITDRDLQEALIPSDCSDPNRSMYHTVKKIKAKDIMTPNPITIEPEVPIDRAARIFVDRKIDCLPVKNTKGKLVGILTSTDILRAFLDLWGILGGIHRIDIVMEANQYEDVLRILHDQEVSIVSVGITSSNDLKRTVFSFRFKEADLERLRTVLRENGYSVLPDS